ncbi:MAG: penicillin-binding protein 2 [Candidatus Zapsychrus exili]|nr:penicillin-binding protein 2 [Candidatus Zapsychrus exili]
MRLKIIRIITIILFLIVILDLFYVQAIRGRYYYNLSKNNRVRIVPLEGWRGRIFDSTGEVLADNIVSFNVMITPQEIKSKQELFSFLADTLGITYKKIEELYKKKRSTPFAPIVLVENIGREKAIILEEEKYRFPSLFIQESFRRVYPRGADTSHVVGYVGKMNKQKIERFKEYGYSPQSIIGYSGIEEYYDSYLKGGYGGLQVEVNSRGEQVRLLSFKEPVKGQDLELTIDSRMQRMAAESLDERPGAFIALDADSGEVLSMVSSPSFDPNVFKKAISKNSLKGLSSSKFSPFLNRVIKGLFPPGSVFKVPIAIAGLDTKKITQHSSFNCLGFYELAGIKFRCTHIHNYQNLIQSLAHSCNVYYYRLGMILGADIISKYARLFSLGKLTHIDLPYEEKGFVSSRRHKVLQGKKWYAGHTLNFSIGQGDLSTTPIQLTRMMATIASDGIEVQPHIIRKIGGKLVDDYNSKRKLKIQKQTFDIVKKGLRETVRSFSGTAHILDIEGIYIAGKTGTAQTSGNKEDHAWFVGYVETSKKKIAFCVFLEHGGSSQNACLTARQILLKMNREGII